MGKIDQAFSTATFKTGSILSEAPAAAFGNNGLSAIAQGIKDVGNGLYLNKKTSNQFAKEAKEKEDNLWLDKSLSEYNRGLTDYETDPQNNSRKDYLPGMLNKADADSEVHIEGAPSPEAAAKFREKARDSVDQRYGRVASKQANNEMAADAESLESTWGQTLSSFHQLSTTDSDGAAQDLIGGLANGIESVLSIYGDIAPDVARKMAASRTADTAMALAEKHPATARELVNESPFLEESTRQQILARVQKKKEEVSLLVKEDFGTAREKAVIAAKQEGRPTNIPLEDYKRIYDGEQAEVMKRRDDSIIEASVSAHTFLINSQGQLPGDRADSAEVFKKTLDVGDKLQAYEAIVQPALVRDAKLFDHDNVQWLTENNEHIQTLAKEIKAVEESGNNPQEVGPSGGPDGLGVIPPLGDTPPTEQGTVVRDPALSAGIREQYYNSLLRYQGTPIEGGDPKKFMNKPPGMRTILTKQQANYYANQINSGTIDDAVSTINGILQQYPNDDLRSHVIADLTSLPLDKVKPEYQIAFQNAKQPWIADYIGAVKSVKDTAELNIIDHAKLRTSIATNPSWVSFMSSTGGPQSQRSGELAGYFNAMETYAKSKIASGLSPKDAAQKAVEQILTSTMSPVEIPGPNKFLRGSNQQLWIPREMFGKLHSDTELKDYGRRMGLTLGYINPEDVDPNQFSAYSVQSDPEKRKDLIHRQIMDSGQFYPDPGGLTYRLTVKSANDGKQVDLRTKDGKLFQLPIDKLPAFSKRIDGEEHEDNVIKWNGKDRTPGYWNFTQ